MDCIQGIFKDSNIIPKYRSIFKDSNIIPKYGILGDNDD
jgi:hypothetical protein